jgi:putative transposase
VIAQIKAESASQLRKKFAWLKQVYWKENIVWSPGFFLSTVGVDKKVIESYVKWQGKKDLDQLQMKL